MHANNSGNQDGWGVLDPDGRIDPHAPALIALGRSAEALRGLHARLLSADLTLLGGRTVATMSAHVAVFTVAERICGSLRFSAGAAMEPNGAVALVAASY